MERCHHLRTVKTLAVILILLATLALAGYDKASWSDSDGFVMGEYEPPASWNWSETFETIGGDHTYTTTDPNGYLDFNDTAQSNSGFYSFSHAPPAVLVNRYTNTEIEDYTSSASNMYFRVYVYCPSGQSSNDAGYVVNLDADSSAFSANDRGGLLLTDASIGAIRYYRDSNNRSVSMPLNEWVRFEWEFPGNEWRTNGVACTAMYGTPATTSAVRYVMYGTHNNDSYDADYYIDDLLIVNTNWIGE